MQDAITRLRQISVAPSEKSAFDTWLEMKDALAFLADNAQENEFVVYATVGHTYMHAIVVPATLLNPPDNNDLMSWNCNASSSWGFSWTMTDPPIVSISPPLDATGSKTLDRGEQLVFARSFEGRVGNKGYFEVLQKFVHLFDLHFLTERNAYCRLDSQGDIEDVIRIVDVSAKGNAFGGTIISFRRDILDKYLVLTDSIMIRTFDFTRYYPSGFSGWSQTSNEKVVNEGDLSYRSCIEPGYAGYTRGFQIVRPLISKEIALASFQYPPKEEKQYVSFIAQDWRHGVVSEISCAPGKTANYFIKSDLPFELSPAFFRPEVLSKYKADSEKYHLEGRSISCRGTWHLQTYDVNEVGQVHTYLVYLRDLPYSEQLHWKSYNESPKAPISRRAIQTDFKGEWNLEYDPLSSLKDLALKLTQRQVPWWTMRSEDLVRGVHYPVTTSADEWSSEIMQLEHLLVEGFEEKRLRGMAESLGRAPDKKFRSLKLVEECLIALGYEADHAHKIVGPLFETHDLRSKLKGHPAGEEALALRKAALAEHGTLAKHFRAICCKCDESMRAITEAFKNHVGIESSEAEAADARSTTPDN
jgi:hypothetical protein